MSEQLPIVLAIRASVLQAHPAEAEVLLRGGTILNGVTSAGRAMLPMSNSMEDRKDRLQSWIVAAAYFNETYEVFTRRHNGLAWKLAELGVSNVIFPTEMSLAKLHSLFERGSSFLNSCGTIRDKWAFHVDPEPFLDWLKRKPAAEGIGILSQSGPQLKDVIADASALAILAASEQLMELDSFGDQIGLVTRAFTPLLESMCVGIAKKFDLIQEHGTKDGHRITYFYERGVRS